MHLFDSTVFNGRKQNDDNNYGVIRVLPDGSFIETAHGEIKKTTWNELGISTQVILTENIPIAHWNRTSIVNIIYSEGMLLALNGRQILGLSDDGSYQWCDLPEWAACILDVGDRLLVIGGSDEGAISEFNRETFELQPVEKEFYCDELYWATAWTRRSEGGYWVSAEDGCVYQLTSSGVIPWFKQKGIEECASQITSLAEFSSGNLAVGTKAHGVYLYRSNGSLIEHLTSPNHLESNQVSNIITGPDHGLWVMSKRHLQRIDLTGILDIFDERNGILGAVKTVERVEQDLFVGTDVGLFVVSDKAREQKFRQIPNISGIHWMEASHGKLLYIDGQNLGQYSSGGIRIIETGRARTAIIPGWDKDWLFYGNGDTLRVCRWLHGKWVLSPEYDSNFRAYGFAEGQDQWIWGGIGVGRVIRFRPNGKALEIEYFDSTDGVPEVWIQPLNFNGKLFLGGTPLSIWDQDRETFVPANFHEYYGGRPPYGFEHPITEIETGKTMVVPAYNRGDLVPRPPSLAIGAIVLMGSNIDSRASSVLYDGDVVWIGCDSGAYSL